MCLISSRVFNVPYWKMALSEAYKSLAIVQINRDTEWTVHHLKMDKRIERIEHARFSGQANVAERNWKQMSLWYRIGFRQFILHNQTIEIIRLRENNSSGRNTTKDKMNVHSLDTFEYEKGTHWIRSMFFVCPSSSSIFASSNVKWRKKNVLKKYVLYMCWSASRSRRV